VVCQTYMEAPDLYFQHHTHTVSVDEMTGIQALERNAKEVPMDLAAAKVVIDIGGRYSFLLKTPAVWEGELISRDEGYSFDDGRDFLDTFAKSAALNMHIEVYSGKDMHHVLEAVFKALGVALDEATQIDPRRRSVPSTKGVIEF